MSTFDRTWRPSRYDADGHRRDAHAFLYGGVRRDDLLISETAVVMGSGITVDEFQVFARAMNAPEEPQRWEPPVVEFGRGPLDAGRFDWGVAAFVALCLGMVGLWAGILVYGLVRGLEELGRAL